MSLVDAFSLLDKVLLHEMTHGRAAYTGDEFMSSQEGLIDVSNPNFFLRWINWAAYGWNGAMQLARKGDNLGGKTAPDNNADTIALFASGMLSRRKNTSGANRFEVCKLMDDPNNPRKVDAKGRIIPR